MRILTAAALLVMVAACDRSGRAPQANVPTAQPPPATTEAAPAAVSPEKPASPRATSNAALKSSKSGSRAVARRTRGDAASAADDPATRIYQTEQEQRDRELLERDAEEAAARDPEQARGGQYDDGQPPEDLPPPPYEGYDDGYDDEQPPIDDEYDPPLDDEEDLPPYDGYDR